jgi:organic radical activating enzyme
MEMGLRIIPTFRCSMRCKFCYQAHLRESGPVLPVSRMAEILDEIDLSKYDYATFMGGEVTEIPDFVDYVKAVKERFDGRINLTTNGTASLKTYLELAHAGVDHITFSSIAPDLADKLEVLKGRTSLRINVFMPARPIPDLTTEYVADMGKVLEMYCIAKVHGAQLNILYDYRTPIFGYESTVDQIVEELQDYVDPNLRAARVDANFAILRGSDGFEAWVDVNYKKGQELVVTPEGELAKGFEYMEKYGGTFQA